MLKENTHRVVTDCSYGLHGSNSQK